MPMTADLSDESLLFQTVRDVTVVLFSPLLSTDSLLNTIVALNVSKI